MLDTKERKLLYWTSLDFIEIENCMRNNISKIKRLKKIK